MKPTSKEQSMLQNPNTEIVTDSMRSCLDIYNDYSWDELSRSPESIKCAWKTGHKIYVAMMEENPPIDEFGEG